MVRKHSLLQTTMTWNMVFFFMFIPEVLVGILIYSISFWDDVSRSGEGGGWMLFLVGPLFLALIVGYAMTELTVCGIFLGFSRKNYKRCISNIGVNPVLVKKCAYSSVKKMLPGICFKFCNLIIIGAIGFILLVNVYDGSIIAILLMVLFDLIEIAQVAGMIILFLMNIKKIKQIPA